MNPDSSLKMQPLEKLPATMTKEKVAEALGVATHNIPPLSRAGLIKPLGRPQRYCVKHYSRDVLAENSPARNGSTRWWRPFTGIGALEHFHKSCSVVGV